MFDLAVAALEMSADLGNVSLMHEARKITVEIRVAMACTSNQGFREDATMEGGRCMERGVGERRGNELGAFLGGWTSRWVTIS